MISSYLPNIYIYIYIYIYIVSSETLEWTKPTVIGRDRPDMGEGDERECSLLPSIIISLDSDFGVNFDLLMNTLTAYEDPV